MKRDAVRTFGTTLLAANLLVAFLSLTNLVLVAAGAIQVDVPDEDDIEYEYDAANQTLLIDTRFTVRNDGIYAVDNLDIVSTLTTDRGLRLIHYARHGLEVRAGEERSFPIQIKLGLSQVASPELLRLLVEDGEFELKVKVRADYTMGLTKFRSDERMVYKWTSPLSLLHDLILEGNLTEAIERALGWAGPIVHGWLSDAVLDAAMAEGEWRHEDLSGWANLTYRLWLDDLNGTGAFDVVLRGSVAGFQWYMNGTVPLTVKEGVVYLEQEVVADGS